MKRSEVSLSKKIGFAMLGIFVLSSVTLFLIQQYFYSRTFDTVLADVETSTLELKREGARDILKEVQIATKGSLERGEFAQFTRYAKEQAQLEEIKEFSFYNAAGKVELSSDQKLVGSSIEPERWTTAQSSKEQFLIEDQHSFAFYYPLRVDGDMRRLYPDRKLGDLYGVLHLEFSKEKINAMLAAARDAQQVSSARTFWVIALATAVASALAMLLALGFCRVILRPLYTCMEALKRLAARDFSQKCDLAGKDEIGQMAHAVNQSMEAMDKAFKENHEATEREKQLQAQRAEEERLRTEEEKHRQAEHVERERARTAEAQRRKDEEAQQERQRADAERKAAEELRAKVDRLLTVVGAAANGDLTHQVLVEGDQPVDELAAGLRRMLQDLSSTIERITHASLQFTEGSRMIAESTRIVANGAQTQGATVEQMAATVEELTRSVETVRENAADADMAAHQTTSLAEQGGHAVDKSIEAMDRIRAGSQRMAEIIQVISGIASQTNLLALNAAIEAARAGEHGMGFAVVADEVRKLAERSNQAAHEISNLIKESTQSVDEGARMNTEMGQSLRKIIDGVHDTATKIGEIATATVQQVSAAHEVSTAIQQLARVAENTSSQSQEMAASTEELGAQSQMLRELVSHFKTNHTATT